MRLRGAGLLLILLVGPAHADDASEARGHYQSAQKHFAVGEFSAAADEYQAAYKLREDAALLFNAAQARRLAGENDKALILYKNYVQFYPKARNLPEVREQIAKLEEAIAAAQSAKTAPPTGTVEPEKKITEAAPAPAAAAEPAPVPERPTPIYKKWWLWTIVGVGVVAAVVIPVAVVTTQPPPWKSLPDVGPGVQGLAVRW